MHSVFVSFKCRPISAASFSTLSTSSCACAISSEISAMSSAKSRSLMTTVGVLLVLLPSTVNSRFPASLFVWAENRSTLRGCSKYTFQNRSKARVNTGCLLASKHLLVQFCKTEQSLQNSSLQFLKRINKVVKMGWQLNNP